MLTKNFRQLKKEVAAHVKADAVAKGSYKTCFIGCLSGGVNNPKYIEQEYGIPRIISRIAESIFEALPWSEAPSFFAAFPESIGCDGKDLSRVGWQFLAAELRALPTVPASVQAVIDLVIQGMDLLAEGKEWSSEAFETADAAVRAARGIGAAVRAVRAARDAVDAAKAARDTRDTMAAWAAASAAEKAAWAAYSADVYNAVIATRRRQRDTLLQLIKEAPVTTQEN